MVFFLYNFFHNETNDRTEKGLVNKIPKDTTEWPDSWKRIVCKKYSLFKSIKLSKNKGILFKDFLYKRKSGSVYFLSNKITLEKISYILQCGYGLQHDINISDTVDRKDARTVPSGGGRYPLEIYFFLFKEVEGFRSGIYHYGVIDHVLEPVMFMDFSQEDIKSLSPQESLKDSQGMFCITSFFERTVVKYGSRGYRYVLLEAGHVAQNILLAGVEKNMYITPIGAVNENYLESFLGLNGSRERVVYTLFI